MINKLIIFLVTCIIFVFLINDHSNIHIATCMHINKMHHLCDYQICYLASNFALKIECINNYYNFVHK